MNIYDDDEAPPPEIHREILGLVKKVDQLLAGYDYRIAMIALGESMVYQIVGSTTCHRECQEEAMKSFCSVLFGFLEVTQNERGVPCRDISEGANVSGVGHG